MAYLRLMGGYTFLRKKHGRMSMMDSFCLELDDVSHVDEIQINGMNFLLRAYTVFALTRRTFV